MTLGTVPLTRQFGLLKEHCYLPNYKLKFYYLECVIENGSKAGPSLALDINFAM